jgi:ubiquinone/menaquinone biosynthesis C-methylase UbiE
MSSNTTDVSQAFSKQSAIFDTLYKENKLSEYLRSSVRKEVLAQLKPNSNILELNCGTGMDAMYFAEKGHTVLATDNALGMLEQLDKKINEKDMKVNINTLHCSFHDLYKIKNKNFDHIVSNFGGLNCTDNLKDVLQQLSPLLNKNGKVTLVIMPKICPWELVMIFKGKFKTAFRRFKKHTPAHIEGVHFLCYYYNPNYIINTLKKEFRVLTLKGIFITVPPEFYANFVERYPKLFSTLSKIDKAICKYFPFTYICDHYIITLQKKK